MSTNAGSPGQVRSYASMTVFPTASIAGNGAIAQALDSSLLYVSDGSAWLLYTEGSGGGGANQALSNLTSPTAVNQNLIFSSTGPNPSFLQTANDSGATHSLTLQSGNSAGSVTGAVNISTGTAGAVSSGGMALNTGDGPGSGNMFLLTGTASSGNSGNIDIIPGTATGTRGQIRFQDGSQGTAGQVWTSTDTQGAGHWAPAGSSGANITLSNLSPTAINQNLTFAPANGGTNSVVTVQATEVVNSPNLTLRSGDSSGDGGSGNIALLSGGTGGTNPSGNISIISGGTGSAAATGNVSIKTGDTGGPASSGSILIVPGSSTANPSGDITLRSGPDFGVGGVAGNIILNAQTVGGNADIGKIQFKGANEGIAGQVWTSTDTIGSGAWAPAGGGGANQQLSNLSGTTAVPIDLLPANIGINLGSAAKLWGTAYIQGTINNGSGNAVVDVGGTQLNDFTGTESVRWGTRQLFANDGLTPQLNWTTPGTMTPSADLVWASAGPNNKAQILNDVATSFGGADTVFFGINADSTSAAGVFFGSRDSAANAASPSPEVILASGDTSATNTPNIGTSPVFITSGNVNGGTGNSGGLNLSTGGTAATGTTTGTINISPGIPPAGGTLGNVFIQTNAGGRTSGKIQLLNGSEGTAGQYWSSTDTQGSGSWKPLIVQSGTNAARPSSPVLGQMYFATDLGANSTGFPLWFDGTNWLDATGTIVP